VGALLGALFSVVTALAGCEERCTRNSDCPPGLLCQPSGMCDAPDIPLPGQADAAAADLDEVIDDLGDEGDSDAGPE
jgi:hypothetical protein